MGIGKYLPRFGFGFTKSPAFEKMCRKSFDAVDVDKDEQLDFKELYLAILKLYDILNAKLPCHMRVPNTEEMTAVFTKYDKNKSGKLDFSEYLEVCRGLVGAKHFFDSVVFKALVVVGLKVALFPLVAKGVKAGLNECGVPHGITDKVPVSVVALGVELACKQTLPLPL
eukprot:CAMPEP_0202866866 /NCGR_PEP_ID=MMETSP1391-20130828/8403_1 /ASSEMBLY_ACC=CAM_ASM_000867 /TAXON_ID=1034604 /ORGANISM="Chlamydomonas leiostraca, Strain SAG 11-49" /LENGTH=168 /DNA_ID=CAMNT_0049546853 /DNA_START=73 /DNA_END=579 /DNA_ORIENTATION=-